MPTRPRGLVQRDNGVWYVRSHERGRDRWRSLRTKDYDTALDRMKRIRVGITEEMPRATIERLAAQWIETLPTTRSAKNVKMTRTRWERYMNRFLGHVPADKLRPDDVREFRLWLDARRRPNGKRLRPLTVAHILADLRCFLRWAEDSSLVPRSVFPRRVMPRIQEEPPRTLADWEVDRLIRLRDPYGFVCRLALETGLRWGELTRATRQDVTADGWLVVHQTKSGRVRRVPLGKEMVTEVMIRKGRLVEFAEGSPGSFTAVVRRLSGVKRFGPHRLRHTFATRFLSRGGSVLALQAILGHSDLKTTQRYGRPDADFIRREAEKVRTAEPVAVPVAASFSGDPSETVKLRTTSQDAPVAQTDRAAVS